jgi:hypothetical protein
MDEPNFQNTAAYGSTAFLVNGLNNTPVEIRNENEDANGMGVSVVGGTAPSTARVEIFGGGFGEWGNDDRAYNVSNGGQLLVEETWEEGGSNQYFDFSFEGADLLPDDWLRDLQGPGRCGAGVLFNAGTQGR